MTRVLLTEWEWACCGDPFTIGDAVDLGIRSRSQTPELTEDLGAAIAATVDAVESHHEEEFTDRVRGRVTAIHAITRDVVERRLLRRPGMGAPAGAAMPPDGAEWPPARRPIGDGVFVGTQPSRYTVQIVPLPDSASLESVSRVGRPEDDQRQQLEPTGDPMSDPPPEKRTRVRAGWLVDVEEHPDPAVE